MHSMLTSTPDILRPVLVEKPKKTFTSFPTDVLSEILEQLDCFGILAIRQTCKALHSVTKSRQLWYNLATKLQQKHGLLPPEEGCDQYTVNELEHWVLRRNQVQNVWAGSTQPHFRSHVIDPCPNKPHPKPSYRKLVPGGRWLLIAYPSAAMYVLDLEDTNPAAHLLFDPGDFDREIARQKVDIDYTLWIDRSKPRLSFLIAGCIRPEGDGPLFPRDDPEDMRTFIYHVELVGHGAGATLVARPYALFRDYQPGYRQYQFALNDQYVVELWDDPHELGVEQVHKEIKVYNYSKSPVTAGQSEYSFIKPIVHKFKGLHSLVVEFINGNVFAVHGAPPHLLHLFEVDCHPDESTLPNSIKLLHIVEMPIYHRSDIRLFPAMSESRLVSLGVSEKIMGLVIPHDKTHPPTARQLGRCNTHWEHANCCTLGISASLFLDRFNKTYGIITHEWNFCPPIQPIPLLVWNDEAPELPREFVGFDEGTGRLVFLNHPHNHTLLIVYVI